MVRTLQGAIIAAGRGDRLRKGGPDIPKPLVRLGGQPLLVRQAQAMMRAGAAEVLAIVNSETALMIEREKIEDAKSRGGRIELPLGLRLMVRDTANSMESLLALGEVLAPGHFLLATVDAVAPDSELKRFVAQARASVENGAGRGFDAMLGVVKWRGDASPLFATLTRNGAIEALGEEPAPTVTAGFYLLPSTIFNFSQRARSAELPALRRFLAMLIDNGLRLGAIELFDVIDIDCAADLAAARAALGVRR